MSASEAGKRAAAMAAAALVESGMLVGLGSGSTVRHLILALARRVREDGLRIVGCPTSTETEALALAHGITLAEPDAALIDLAIDGADEVERGSLRLIKGLGGALLREKIVAAASRRMVVIVDESKLATPFGARCPVPVEITRFGWQATERKLAALAGEVRLRRTPDQEIFVTDGGNFILDCHFGAIANPAALDAALHGIVGVVETGLFIGLATEVVAALGDRVEILTRD
jgi:ribose 5-phosphate isomerase A